MTNRGRFVVVAVGLIGAVSVTSCGQVSRQPLASSAGGTRQPGAALTPAFTDASPFYGTPAFDYADGAAGIVAPRAHAVGTFTAAQVAGAYKTVKELLVASALDQPTLRGERPADFGGLLIKQQRTWFYAHLSQPVRPKAGPPWLTRTWVTAFAPDAALVGGVIKVTGEPMTASAIHVSGRLALQVTASYLFVYPMEQVGHPASRIRIVEHLQAMVQFARWDDPGGSLEPWVYEFGGSFAGAQCGHADGFIHPAFPATGTGSVQPSGNPVDPYSLGTPVSKAACQATTGT
jgi:hypothetical protein